MELLPHELAAAAAGPRPALGFLHVPAWHTRLVAAGGMAKGRGCGRTLISGSPAGRARRRDARPSWAAGSPRQCPKTKGRRLFPAARGFWVRRVATGSAETLPRHSPVAQDRARGAMAAAADCNRERRRFRRRMPHAWFGTTSTPPPPRQLIPHYSCTRGCCTQSRAGKRRGHREIPRRLSCLRRLPCSRGAAPACLARPMANLRSPGISAAHSFQDARRSRPAGGRRPAWLLSLPCQVPLPAGTSLQRPPR